MSDLGNSTVGSIVAQNWKTALVFQKYGIDFCCNGGAVLTEACIKKGLDEELLIKEVSSLLDQVEEPESDFNTWDLGKLADYIETKHHGYVADNMPVLLANLHRVCTVHGSNHPELLEIRDIFRAIAQDLTVHMKREEFMIFPVIKKMASSLQNKERIPAPTFGSIQNPIAVMMQDHENEGERLRNIAKLTNQYTPPEDACGTYKLSFSMLEDFERDLHKHIHLENNILFPKAILLEKDLYEAVG